MDKNGRRLSTGFNLITLVASTAVVAAALTFGVGQLFSNGPPVPLVNNNQPWETTDVVRVGGEVVARVNYCVNTDELLVVVSSSQWRRGTDGDLVIFPGGLEGVYENPPGCIERDVTFILPEGLPPGTWQRVGVSTFDYRGQEYSVAFAYEPFEVVP